MKRMFFAVMAASLMAVACQTEKIESPLEYGTIDVALEGEPLDVVVKATTLTPAQAADYNISIYNSSNQRTYGPEKYSAFKAQVLKMGTYYVTAESCTETEAETGNGKARYYGKSSNVTLSASNMSATATVPCAPANASVTVQFDPSVSGKFTDLKVTFTGGTTSSTRPAITESSTAKTLWFNPSNVNYTISGTFNPNGKTLTLSGSFSLTAKDQKNLLVKLNLENGELVAPTITVDVTMNAATTVEQEFNPYN